MKNTQLRSKPVNVKSVNANSFSHQQSGSVLIVVLFVVVVMGMLGGVMARLEWSNQDTQTRELLDTQAWFMAHSANELALTKLFPLSERSDNDQIKAHCDAVNANGASGIDGIIKNDSCRINAVTCIYPNIPEDYKQLRYYTLESTVSCGNGIYQVERAQQVMVKGLGESTNE